MDTLQKLTIAIIELEIIGAIIGCILSDRCNALLVLTSKLYCTLSIRHWWVGGGDHVSLLDCIL